MKKLRTPSSNKAIPHLESQSVDPLATQLDHETKRDSTVRIIEFPEANYNARVSTEQLSAIWNDGATKYDETELLIIRDWLYNIAEIIIEVINKPGFVPPEITTRDTLPRKAKLVPLPSKQPKSNSINIPQYKEAKTAS